MSSRREQALGDRIDRLVGGDALHPKAAGTDDDPLTDTARQLAQDIAFLRTARPGFQAALEARLRSELPRARRPWWQRWSTHQWQLGRTAGVPRAGARAVAVGILALFLALGAIGTVSAAHGIVQGWVQHYGFVLVNHTQPRPTPHPPSSPQAQPEHYVTFEEAQRRVPFAIRRPTWLPPGLVLSGYGAPLPALPSVRREEKVFLVYRRNAPGPLRFLTISETQPTPSISSRDLIAAGKVRSVSVNGHPALYAHGSWNDDGSWNDALDAAYLSWDADGLTYTIITQHLGLPQAEVLRVAASLR